VNQSSPPPVTVCPVCSASETEVYFEDARQTLDPSDIGSSRMTISPGRILRCRRCRFGFREKRASPEQLHELYRQMDPKVYESESEGRNRTARRHLQIVRQQVASGRLLDIGCASGLFLSHAVQAGWDVTGVEPNEKLCEQARERLEGRAELHCGTLQSVALEGEFQAITLWDVLEHVPDPSAFLLACRRLLHPNGFLFLNVPDLDSPQARILKRRWPLLLPEHLNYFNRPSLRFCAEHAHFTPIRFGRRYAWFSMNYVAYRMAQHEILGTKILKQLASGVVGGILLPVSLGEIDSVLKIS
jgi:2-polyprenyl-3-methyl-5-hydroxy-6-metoxy-1,4-benzoquinol methylase